jgi:predicted DNA-binding transcriptional regulator AlpA
MTLIGRAKVLEMLDISSSTSDRWERSGLLPRAIRAPGMRPKWDLAEIMGLVDKLKGCRPPRQK